MKNLKILLALCLTVLLLSNISIAQNLGDYRSKATGNWNSTDTWETYDGTNWVSATATPTSADGAITIRNGHTVTVTADVTVDQVTIDVGGRVDIATAVNFTIANSPDPIDMQVNGIIARSGSLTVNGTVAVGNGGKYLHNVNGGTIPIITWQTGSICEVIGITSGTSINCQNQTFYHFIWNNPSQSTSVNAISTLTAINGDLSIISSNGQQFRLASTTTTTVNISGNLNISGNSFLTTTGSAGSHVITVNIGGNINLSGGTLGFVQSSATGDWNLYGDFNMSGGTLQRGGSGTGRINFVGGSTHYFNRTGGTITSSNGGPIFVVTSGNTLVMGTSVIDNGPFTLSDGATLVSAHISGLNGNLTTPATKSLSTSANYTFNGTSAQVTGALMPTTVNNLTINNSAGVTLSGNVTVNGKLSVGPGTFNAGSNIVTINGTFQMNEGGWATGENDFVYNAGSTLVFNTTSQYGVNSDHKYWPWTNGPTNVNIIGSGGIKLNCWRPVNGLFQTSAGVEIPTGEKLIANGQVRINTGGYFVNQGPEYGSASTLIYATGAGGYNTWLEWPLTNSPTNVEIINATPVTLSESKTISGNLNLESGRLILGNYNITVGSISSASASGYIVTNGTGSLIRNVGASNVLFPVGTTASYNPVTINNAGTADNFSVRVKSSFDNPPVNLNQVVNRQWTIDEGVSGGSDATITFQWNAADEASGFDRLSDLEVGRWTGTQWEGYAAIYNGGSDPYTATVGNISQFSNFSLGNKGALPVQLASFIGNVIANGKVKLEWQTISEIENLGFYVEKFNPAVNDYVTVSELIAGAGTTLQPQTYSWIDENAVEAVLQYRLKQVDMNGLVNYFGPIMLNPTGVIDNSVPAVFALNQNYPNPFNPSTTITFSLAEANYTTLKVYNLLGSEVATLFAGDAEAGKLYTVKLDGSQLSSGIYLYKLQSGKNVEVRKLMLMK